MIIFVLPFFVAILFVNSNLNAASKLTIDKYNSELEKFKNCADSVVSDVENIFSNLNTGDLKSYYYSQNFSAAQRYMLRSIIKSLSNYIITDSDIRDVCIYLPNSGYLLTSNGTYDSLTAYKWFEKISNDATLFIKSERVSGATYTSAIYNDGGVSMPVLMYTRPVLSANPSPIVIVLLNQDRYLNRALQLNPMINRTVTIVSDNTPELNAVTNNYEEKANFKFTLDSQSYIAAFTNSEIGDWKYLVLTPEKIFNKDYSDTLNKGGLLLLQILCVSVVASWYFYKKIHVPLRTTISSFSLWKSVEYKDIENLFKELSSENLRNKEIMSLKIPDSESFSKQSTAEDKLLNHFLTDDLHQLSCPLSEENSTELHNDFRNEKIVAIVNYVDLHFREQDISITSLAEVFGLSESYISRCFKKQTGVGFLKYLHAKRLQEAKLLLAENKISVKSVANLVGYSSDITMIRAFKRYEGVTPGSFKMV